MENSLGTLTIMAHTILSQSMCAFLLDTRANQQPTKVVKGGAISKSIDDSNTKRAVRRLSK